MSNEEKTTETCLCKSECFKKFILTTAAAFIGAYCALSLLMAIHKPPCPPAAPMMPPQVVAAPQAMPPHNMMPPKGPDFSKMDKKNVKFPPRPDKVVPEQNAPRPEMQH